MFPSKFLLFFPGQVEVQMVYSAGRGRIFPGSGRVLRGLHGREQWWLLNLRIYRAFAEFSSNASPINLVDYWNVFSATKDLGCAPVWKLSLVRCSWLLGGATQHQTASFMAVSATTSLKNGARKKIFFALL